MKKYVKLMADFCSDSVWGKDGVMLCLDSLPISDNLKDEIRKWQSWYDRDCQDYLDPLDRTKYFDVDKFNREGNRLSAKLAKELPGWEIVLIEE